MRDYAKGRIRGKLTENSVAAMIERACAEAYHDGEKAERTRCAKFVNLVLGENPHWHVDGLLQMISSGQKFHRPKPRRERNQK